MTQAAGWIHHFEPGSSDLTLLLLHGTGGNERSLLEVAREVAPQAHLLSVRGRSLEEGSPRFFRRYTDTRYDQAHLTAEADALADFVGWAASQYGFSPSKVVALGYSNGANIGVTLLIRHPSGLSGAVLWRPVMPLEDPPAVNLHDKSVLLTLGAHDPYRPYAQPLLAFLTTTKAQLEVQTWPTGHGLTRQDLEFSRDWLRRHFAPL